MNEIRGVIQKPLWVGCIEWQVLKFAQEFTWLQKLSLVFQSITKSFNVKADAFLGSGISCCSGLSVNPQESVCQTQVMHVYVQANET